MRRAVFLDRDGVINQVTLREGRPYPPGTLEDFELLPGVPEAVGALRKARFVLIVVTNQPDVATGAQRVEVVEDIHREIMALLPIDEIKVCYHIDEDRCGCRKPKPGMLLEAAADRSISLADSFMVGDRWRDIEAGKSAGCQTILLENNYSEQQAFQPDNVVTSLLEASALILQDDE